VRSSLLAILTIGEAYGFQLHGELAARTAERRRVNVGQIYGTLDRLVGQGAVESAGSTPDGLPLYRLTDRGHAEAVAWLHDTTSPTGDDWDEMVERILIASSLPHLDVQAIVRRYREVWCERIDALEPAAAGPVMGSGQARLAAAADVAQAHAALVWLDAVSVLVRESTTPTAGGTDPVSLHRQLSPDRPRRGRRPSLAPSA
jgi:DNA-binding PadR family transcriptional regulator